MKVLKRIVFVVLATLTAFCVLAAILGQTTGTDQGAKNSVTMVFLLLACFPLFGLWKLTRKKSVAPKSAPQPLQKKETMSVIFPSANVVTLPDRIDDKQGHYIYEGISLTPAPDLSRVQLKEWVDFDTTADRVAVLQNGVLVGWMPEDRRAGMVKDWKTKGDPIKAFVCNVEPNENLVKIHLAFYENLIEKAEKRGDKPIRLQKVGAEAVQDAAEMLSVGDRCLITQADDGEHLEVFSSFGVVGTLPADAAEDADVDDIAVIAKLDENDDGKVVPFVYLF